MESKREDLQKQKTAAVVVLTLPLHLIVKERA